MRSYPPRNCGVDGVMSTTEIPTAKSGRTRTSPLVSAPDGDACVIVASKGGHPRHPAWFHNLRAHPDTTIQVGSRRMPVRARVATPEERKRLWPKAVAVWSGYE